VKGGAGEDRLFGQGGADRALGGGGDDLVVGQAGADRLIGQAGADRLVGNAGDDTIVGNRGADTLLGLNGDDLLNGGPGADTYVFGGSWGADTVRNFATAAFADPSDSLQFVTGNGEAESFAEFVAFSSQTGDAVVYDKDDDGVNVITLESTFLGNITADDLAFIA
jgi:Ca2+-binding RTX toxin-like protein